MRGDRYDGRFARSAARSATATSSAGGRRDHDLVEFKHGDTPTLRITTEERRAKETLEADALRDLEAIFADSWVYGALRIYHEQILPEARFVRAMDKNMPKLTHLNNGCAVLRKLKMTSAEFRQRILVEQSADMQRCAGEFLCVMDMHRRLGERICGDLPESCGVDVVAFRDELEAQPCTCDVRTVPPLLGDWRYHRTFCAWRQQELRQARSVEARHADH